MGDTICCFTGHRNLPQQEVSAIAGHLADEIRRLAEAGTTEFRSGGARGFDLLAAEAVLQCRAKMPAVKLMMILPCPQQDRHWPKKDQARYRDILSQADGTVYVAPHYFTGCMHLRNRSLVDGASVCIAYLKEECGGTQYTVGYALKKGLAVINLAEK